MAVSLFSTLSASSILSYESISHAFGICLWFPKLYCSSPCHSLTGGPQQHLNLNVPCFCMSSLSAMVPASHQSLNPDSPRIPSFHQGTPSSPPPSPLSGSYQFFLSLFSNLPAHLLPLNSGPHCFLPRLSPCACHILVHGLCYQQRNRFTINRNMSPTHKKSPHKKIL